jgi:hypothetical protein
VKLWRRRPARAPRAEPISCADFDERLRSLAWGEMGEWLREQRGVESCVEAGLRQCRERKDWEGFARYVLAADIHPSKTYIETLGEVLDERHEDVENEAIVDVLNAIFDTAAVPYLGRAITLVPDWDDVGHLSRKAVWALDRIHTPEALEAIRQAAHPGLPEPVLEAVKEALAR